jgi:hypothetical protein
MKSNSKEEVSRFTYHQSGCVVEGEKKGEKTKAKAFLKVV